MGRKRRRINQHLPKHVYRKGAGFVYRQGGKDTYLCKQTAPQSELWAAYERVTEPCNTGTLQWLLDEYFQRKQFKSERTEKAYREYARTLVRFSTASGTPFGEALVEQITRRTIRAYLDKYPAPISANRQIQFLKAAWGLVSEFHDLPDNPCIGVRLNTQGARTRYVTQEEFAGFKAQVGGYVALFMELGYLLRARWSEVQKLTPADVLDEGVRLERGKGSEGEITAWTPRLREAVQACRQYNSAAPTPIEGAALIHDRKGRPIRQNTFQTAWGRAMRAWEAAGNERFTFHDLKAAGYSDQTEQFAGHRSGKMHSVYNRKLRIVQPPG